jgi:hypothetical protein
MTTTSPSRESAADRIFTLLFVFWAALSALIALAAGIAVVWKGEAGLREVLRAGAYSRLDTVVLSCGILWLLTGALVWLLRRGPTRQRWGWALIPAFLLIALYANVLREHMIYGDVDDYLQAAHNLADGAPLLGRYIYPPLWATALSAVIRFGDKFTFDVMWSANLLAAGLFFVLLTELLRRYGFSRTLAAVAVLLFCAVNMPLLRTLLYVQVNLHVINLILLAVLLLPRSALLSAIALALAVHLKMSPILLALPFLLVREKRWWLWFVLALAAFCLPTLLAYGTQPFLDSFANIQNIYLANGLQFRETSIDSLLRNLMAYLRLPLEFATIPVLVMKGFLLLAGLWICRHSLRGTGGEDASVDGPVRICLPVLLILMMLVSPLVWEHHPVFVALPLLAVLPMLRTAPEWAVAAGVYFAEFLLPTIDFFPWSFLRLAGLIALLWLWHRTPGRTPANAFRDWGFPALPAQAD